MIFLDYYIISCINFRFLNFCILSVVLGRARVETVCHLTFLTMTLGCLFFERKREKKKRMQVTKIYWTPWKEIQWAFLPKRQFAPYHEWSLSFAACCNWPTPTRPTVVCFKTLSLSGSLNSPTDTLHTSSIFCNSTAQQQISRFATERHLDFLNS